MEGLEDKASIPVPDLLNIYKVSRVKLLMVFLEKVVVPFVEELLQGPSRAAVLFVVETSDGHKMTVVLVKKLEFSQHGSTREQALTEWAQFMWGTGWLDGRRGAKGLLLTQPLLPNRGVQLVGFQI